MASRGRHRPVLRVMAVVQDGKPLAVIGIVGGFLAPLLASTGEGRHVILFSYYLLLTCGIVGIASFKAWRMLNWIGFIFTFGVATMWGVTRYEARQIRHHRAVSDRLLPTLRGHRDPVRVASGNQIARPGGRDAGVWHPDRHFWSADPVGR